MSRTTIRLPGLSREVYQWFFSLAESGVLAPVDWSLSETLLRLAGSVRDPVRDVLALSSAIVSSSSREGDALLDLSASGRSSFLDALPGGIPPPSSWAHLLEELPSLVGRAGCPGPLVLDRGYLYLCRYYLAETRVAASLARRLLSDFPDSSPGLPPDNREAECLARYFPVRAGVPGEARQAALSSLSRSLLVLTGGPGTGKTWTASRIIALHRALFPSLRIVAVAPTGKAAARMGQAMAESDLSGDPPPSMTLHRLLESGSSGFSRNRHNPLDWDFVLVDELSMIDLPLMDRLLEALPERSRLVLTGDQNQLASVGAGSVMSDLCSSLCALPDGASRKGALHVLTHNFRQSEAGTIREFTRAVAAGAARPALEILGASPGPGEVEWIDCGSLPEHGSSLPLSRISDGWAPFSRATSLEEAHRTIGSFMVLSALREGPLGSREINRRVHGQRMRRSPSEMRFSPVLILENSYDTGLMNGDLGAESREGLSFEKGGIFLSVLPRLAPEREYAYAMTVHKSQGSEFDHVLLVFGSVDHPLLTRALLYTAATRARRRLSIWASREVLERMIQRGSERSSALGERLADLLSERS